MKINDRYDRDICIMEISGNMMGGPDTQELHEKVKNALGDGIKKIVIDLSNVKWMNSSGLGTLMSTYSSITRESATVKLAGTTEKIKSLLIITKLLQFFENYESVDRAIAAYK
ncbi:MAG: hypothetical protein Kow00108_21960 [Calditrichia bacterium]